MPTANRSGFSLVELMIVVGIISLLGALAIPSLKRARERAQVAQLIAEYRAIADGIEMFWAENKKPTAAAAKWGSSGYPTGMDTYFPKRNDWQSGPKTGGLWLWLYFPGQAWGFDSFICLYLSQMTPEQIQQIDSALDDGDVATGAFRSIPPFVYYCLN